jgi:hypothetical protein
MSTEIKNSFKSSSIIRVTDDTLTVNIADLARDSSETVIFADIKRVMWSTNTAITVTRNGSIVLDLFNSGDMRFSDYGYSLSANNVSPIVVAASSGTIVLEVTKESTFSPSLDTL